MKSIIVLIMWSFMPALLTAQKTKAKKAESEKAPTQAEIQEVMNEMQRQLQNMTPEEKKMMEQMGVKMPSLNDVPKPGNTELANAWEDENRIVPKKDQARIATISKNPLTVSAIPAFLNSVHNYVQPRLKSSSRDLAEKIFVALQSGNNNRALTGNNAALLWTNGKIELALYIMGKTAWQTRLIRIISATMLLCCPCAVANSWLFHCSIT